jgi:two-component system, chemotaxis family, protein-glutamate methylesterase/glutaminase
MGDPVPVRAPPVSGIPVCFPGAAYDLVAIAGSAGGMAAARRILAALPPDFPAPIALVQHLSPMFPSHFDKLIGAWSRLSARFAADRERLRPRTVHLAPPDHHLLVGPDRRLALSPALKVNFTRPAADPLFETAAAAFGDRLLAVVLSGMGRDGARGAAAVRAAGGTVLVQNPRTAEAAQMPAAAIAAGAAGAASLVLPLEAIAPALIAFVMQPGVAVVFRTAAHRAAT